ncbi:MAG: N-acetylmuramoyl-L-alanine amidase [Clostridia bacterium]
MEQNNNRFKPTFKKRKGLSKKAIIILTTIILIVAVLAAAIFVYFKVIRKPAENIVSSETVSLTEQLSQFSAEKKAMQTIGGLYVDINEYLPSAEEIRDVYKQNTITITLNAFDVFYNDGLDYFSFEDKPAFKNLFSYTKSLKDVGIHVFLKYDPLLLQKTNTVNQQKFGFLGVNSVLENEELRLKSNDAMVNNLTTQSKKIATLSIDGVILKQNDVLTLKTVAMAMKQADKLVGISTDETNSDYTAFKEIPHIDFAELLVSSTTKPEIDSFGDRAKAKIKELSDLNVSTVVTHTQSNSEPVLLYSLATTYNSLTGTKGYLGSIFSFKALKSPDAFKALSLLYNNVLDFDVANTELNITSPENNFKTDKSGIMIAGTCDNNFPLTMNGETVTPSEKGLFSIDVTLKQGSNTFTFSHKNKTSSVTIIYDINVIKSISPTKDILISAGSPMTFSVTALDGASVSGSIGSTPLKFKKNTDALEDEDHDLDGYSEFTADYITPELSSKGKKSIGKFTATASFSGISKTMSGGSITIEKKFVAPPKPPANNGGSGDNGDGSNGSTDGNGNGNVENPTGYIAEMNVNWGENFTKSITGNLELSTPLYGYLSRGTRDYIIGEAFYKDYSYYRLNSGMRVHQKDCKIYESSENLYSNVNSVSANNTGMYTDITLGGSKGNPFTVSFNTNYDKSGGGFDCVFGTNTISFDISNVVSGCDVSSLSSPLFRGASFVKISDSAYRFTINLRNSGRFYGYKSYVNESGELVLRLKNPKFASGGRLDGFKILVDPGHEGDDYNFSPFYPRDRTKSESTLNLQVSLLLKSELENIGASVAMTRYTKYDENNRTETQMKLMNGDFDCFVSVHHNSSSSSSTSGFLTLYFYPFNQGLSGDFLQTLESTGVYPNPSISNANRFQNVQVLRQHSTVGSLLELGYNTNKHDIEVIINPNNQAKFAREIKNGVLDFFR